MQLQLGSDVAAILGAGKSELFRSIRAGEAPKSRHLVPEIVEARAATPATRLKDGHLLAVFDLWDIRSNDGRTLSQSQNYALAVAAGIAATADLLLIDCALDLLPNHLTKRAIAELLRLSRQGSCVVVATRRTEIAELFPRVVMLHRGRVAADGSPSDLVAGEGREEIVIETADPSGLRSLVAPMRVTASPEGGTLRLVTDHGLDRSAQLLRDGYGNVEAVVIRQPTLGDVWERIRSR